MNKVILMGRLTRDPEIRRTQGRNGELTIAQFSIAVDRRFSKKSDDANEPTADFFNCTSFGKQAEFVEKYLKQGIKIVVVGRIENDNYTNKSGEKVYAVKILVEEVEFAESKKASEAVRGDYIPSGAGSPAPVSSGDFIAIPEGIEDNLPFR